MADITPTQAKVLSGLVRQVYLQEDVTILGQLLAYKISLPGYGLATAGGTTEEAQVLFMAVETGLKDTFIAAVDPGAVVDLGIVLSIGVDYALSATTGLSAGRIAPYSDLISTNIATFVGIAKTASELLFNVVNSKTAIP